MMTAAQIQSAIDSFSDDPADSQFQRGYLAALEWVMKHDEKRALEPGETEKWQRTTRDLLLRQYAEETLEPVLRKLKD